MSAPIHNVPTNIISGFLGVGKTTAILDLFSKKPETEKWAVLVNEFGKVGIDGRIYQAKGIAVKEIPGGCMCCAQGLPLQVAVNRLLRETRPDRLIIESSGVGHPAGVLKTLQGEGFNEVLALKAGICLLDPECLLDPAYRDNELFKEQIQFADVLVANKTDLASIEALQAFDELSDSFEPAKAQVAMTTKGQLALDWFAYEHQSHAQTVLFKPVAAEHSQNWQTHTFRYSADTLFDVETLRRWLATIDVIRLKGLVQMSDGFYLLNFSAGNIDITPLDLQTDSYIEVIDLNLDVSSLESGLAGCIIN
jgi:G3E family GTPase